MGVIAHYNTNHESSRRSGAQQTVSMPSLVDGPSFDPPPPLRIQRTSHTHTNKGRRYIHYNSTTEGTAITVHSSDPMLEASPTGTGAMASTGACPGEHDGFTPPTSPLSRFFSISIPSSPSTSSSSSSTYTPPSIALSSKLGTPTTVDGSLPITQPQGNDECHRTSCRLPQHLEDDVYEQLEQRLHWRSQRTENRKRSWLARLRELPMTLSNLHCLLNNESPQPTTTAIGTSEKEHSEERPMERPSHDLRCAHGSDLWKV